MGLDISVADYGFRAGSYHGFHAFRCWLANQIGINYNTDNLDDISFARLNDDDPRQGLLILLMHSDCDGVIEYEGARELLKGLRAVKKGLRSFKDVDEDEQYYRSRLHHWIIACERSIKHKEPIQFG